MCISEMFFLNCLPVNPMARYRSLLSNTLIVHVSDRIGHFVRIPKVRLG